MASPTDLPRWAWPSGVPTAHVARAAVHVAAVIDANGSRVVDADESYWRRATGGLYAPPDLQIGQQLLVDIGLVEQRDGMLYPRPDLQRLVAQADDGTAAALALWAAEQAVGPTALPPSEEALAATLEELVEDPAHREEMLLALARRFDDSYQRLLGEIGEDLVVDAARAELTSLGYPDLAAQVRRISLQTDQAGYDVRAPRVIGKPRLLEVKATSAIADHQVRIHVSRNEFETGRRYRVDWALVICRILSVRERDGEILGWVPASALERFMPADGACSSWESALVHVELASLIPGLPISA